MVRSFNPGMVLQYPLTYLRCSVSDSFLEYSVKNFEAYLNLVIKPVLTYSYYLP